MEIINTLPKAEKYNFYRNLTLKLLAPMKLGRLNITLPEGANLTLGEGDEIIADIQVKDNIFFKKCVLFGDIGFGEAYVDGYWDTSNITNVIKWMILNVENAPTLSGSKRKFDPANLMQLFNRVYHLANKNNKTGAQKNIEYHYDLSNDFYKLWLDPTMTYSSGLFKTKEDTLEQAQINKYENLCQNLELKQEDHVLEIGSGWGGFACYAAKNYGCKITTITISKEQYDYAKNRIEQEGLNDLIDIRFQDYREVQGQFDKIVSIEMLEAVGHEFLKPYFQKCHELLKTNGIFSFQVITSPDSRYDEFRKGVDWIQKHIFPGSLLPSVGEMNKVINKVGNMHMIKMLDMGPMYARTLHMWFENFNKEIDNIKKLNFDEKFARKWRYYLNYCEAAFFMRNISVVQLTYTRPNNIELRNTCPY
jgi:cyclopropane-fatty-acyl-phospholipid synthase